MTNTNLSSKNNYPFMLKPTGKDYLWGGNRLNEDYNKNIEMNPLAETWECSTHPDGPSYVASGEFKGKKLSEILKIHPEFIGTHPNKKGELPILVKLIDAKADLSIQVHPNDEYAQKYENGSLGKTEMWYVLDASKNAFLIHGFNTNVSKQIISNAVNKGKLEKYLNRIKVNKEDLFFIEAGTIHAIGAGTMVAEIQENSNITYRLYDYNRVGKDGKKRELHIDKALDVLNYKSSKIIRQPMMVYKHKNGYSSQFLCRCKYFEVYKESINTEKCKNMYTFKTEKNSFHILLCIDGCGVLLNDKETLPFFRGDCIFVPANSVKCKLHGVASLLNINC